MRLRRPAVAGLCSAVLVVAGCGSGPAYRVVCDDALPDQELVDGDCDTVAAAVVADLDADDSAAAVVVVAYRGCPPGAFCQLLRDAPPAENISALIGVRLSDGESLMRHVVDMDAWPGVTIEPIGGYDATQFIDGFLAGASRSSDLEPASQ
jgi:hypothetical protein